jgi:isoleucyl-tRNA synthetase
MSPDYMEAIWWVFKQVYDKGLVYEAFQSLPYCPRCATPLSNFETSQGYKENVPADSLYVLFPLRESPEYLLAWTTTPWTLPGNILLALGGDFCYLLIKILEGEHQGKSVWVLKERVRSVFRDISYEVLKEEKGSNLIKKYTRGYKPLFSPLKKEAAIFKDCLFRLVEADFVSAEEGTGIVHIAPAYGEEDLLLTEAIFGKEKAKEIVELTQHIDSSGQVKKEFHLFAGSSVFEFNDLLKEKLLKEGKVLKEEKIFHSYPFCWRCDSPLIFYALPAWYIAVSKIKNELVAANKKIHWVPAHLKEGRFGKWLQEARDWAISRQRFWGTPLPIWRCPNCQKIRVFGSKEELLRAVGQKITLKDLHRPEIDAVLVPCSCGAKMRRVEEVLDCWFESGAMPYAHQDILKKFAGDIEKFLKSGRFPADFIAEGQDQTRGWFYTLLVLSVILTKKPAFKNVIVNGMILAKDGKKLSKKLRNYPEVSEVFASYGADALRLFLLSSPAVEAKEVRFSSEELAKTAYKSLNLAKNLLKFFQDYAKLHNLKDFVVCFQEETILDFWLKHRTFKAVLKTKEALLGFRLAKAAHEVIDYINDLSLWYLRRNRDRVRADVDSQKARIMLSNLLSALYHLAFMMLPFTPFFAEHIFLTLKEYLKEGQKLPVSLQLSLWPNTEGYNDEILKDMLLLRKLVSEILNQRKNTQINVRQPLRKATIAYPGFLIEENLTAYERIICEETNILEVVFKKAKRLKVNIDTQIDEELRFLGAKREFLRLVQNLRKLNNCKLSDKIDLEIFAESEFIYKLAKEVNKEYGKRLLINSLTFRTQPENNFLTAEIFGNRFWLSIKRHF